MKDSFDLTGDIISLIDYPAIKSMITGGIYADDRPDNSQLIDIVVNSLGVTNRQFQKGSGNVNVHVPNLPSGRKDSVRLRSISKALKPYLDAQFRDTFHTDIDDGGALLQDTDGSWFYNIPINYYSLQENFKNL